jgi:hypothetical protein
MKSYFTVVADFVGFENICNGPSNGPISKIKFIDGFLNIPTEEQIQAKIAELTAAEPLRLLREQRNQLLQQSDWMAVSDRVMTQSQIDYRQALRDLPATADPQLDENGQLTGITWPTPPND